MVIESNWTVTGAFGSQSQKRKKFRQIHQTCSLSFFVVVQRLPAVLLIQQFSETVLHARWQPESRQIVRDFDFNLNALRHIDAGR